MVVVNPSPQPPEGRSGASRTAGITGKYGNNEHPKGTSTLWDQRGGGGGGGRAGRVTTAMSHLPSQRNVMAVWCKAARYCRFEMDLLTSELYKTLSTQYQEGKCGQLGWSCKPTALEDTTLGLQPPPHPLRAPEVGTSSQEAPRGSGMPQAPIHTCSLPRPTLLWGAAPSTRANQASPPFLSRWGAPLLLRHRAQTHGCHQLARPPLAPPQREAPGACSSAGRR